MYNQFCFAHGTVYKKYKWIVECAFSITYIEKPNNLELYDTFYGVKFCYHCNTYHCVIKRNPWVTSIKEICMIHGVQYEDSIKTVYDDLEKANQALENVMKLDDKDELKNFNAYYDHELEGWVARVS